MRNVLAAALLCAATVAVHAGVGLAMLPGLQDDGPIAVFYPAAQAERTVQRGPFTLSLAQDAPPARGNGRLVVISHGSGGSAWVHADLARTLVAAGFVVAVPRHHRDNALDPSRPGPQSWKLRPCEVSRAIDAVARAPALAPQLSLDRVGVFGLSAGGHAALSFAGGRWSPARFASHCEQHIADDFPACAGLYAALRGNAFDEVKKKALLFALRRFFGNDSAWHTHHDARVQAVVAAVPLAADFDPASLASPRVPLGFVTAGHDKWLAPALHAGAILQACQPRCELLAHLATGGHGSMLSPPPPLDRLGDIAADLLGDPPGFDRSLLPAVNQRVASFFRNHLLP